MNSFKPEMSLQQAQEYLKYIEGNNISNVSAIEMGEISRVFSYMKDNRQFVIHFKSSRDSLDKSKYMYDHFSSKEVPIPKVISIGALNQLYYSITEKVLGQPVSSFKEKDMTGILDKVAKLFTNIADIKIDKTEGFGWISPYDSAACNTWIEYLTSFFSRESEFYGDWTKLYEESFLERDLFEDIYSAMIKLAEYAPEEPYLVHGDFHLGNMLSDGNRITGIVDWEMAMYGDFILDLATIHFWSPHLQLPQRVLKAWEAEGRTIPHFEERLLCYQLFKGVDGLRFFAKKDSRSGYDYVKNKLMNLLKGNK
jgi:hygromycin-B 4-O-kinase